MIKFKHKGKLTKAVSLLLAANMVLSAVVATDFFYDGKAESVAYAAESSTMGTNNYYTTGATLTARSTYTFGGYSWVAAEVYDNYTVLQSTGVTAGSWPGYVMGGTLYNAAGEERNLLGANQAEWSSIDGFDISGYNSTMSSLYSNIQAAEYTSATYGKGLFLQNKNNGTTSNYVLAFRLAAQNYSSFGASMSFAWNGTLCSYIGSALSGSAFGINGESEILDKNQGMSGVVAPAFNLDSSKVGLSGTALKVFTDSTSISATQSVTSVEEGSSVDLSMVITGVTYADGYNSGNSTSYKISASEGTINGTEWTVPTGNNVNKTVTLTITETGSGKKLTTTKNVTVTPTTAASTSLEVDSQILPDSIQDGDTIDLSKCLTLKGTDSKGSADGTITSYTLSSTHAGDSFNKTADGYFYTPGEVTEPTDITITVTPGTVGSVDYSGLPKTFTIIVKPKTTGQTDRNEALNELKFHTYKDSATGIIWYYKYTNNGNVSYLYTEDDVANIIKGGVLLVPASINGVKVVGIGGGWDKESNTTIPFIPSGMESTESNKVNNTWTSIYIPSSVETINDGAFQDNCASAEIVIPDTVKKIGVRAFEGSKITKVTFNAADSLKLFDKSFSDITTLKDVVFRGNVTIHKRVFLNDTGITSVDIPEGTSFCGETGVDDTYAFQGTTGLETIKINTQNVPSNICTNNKNLTKVVFGEMVESVSADWAGTKDSVTASETVVDRSTYVLNDNTVFEMVPDGSPFGYAGQLTVEGKAPADLNTWQNGYTEDGTTRTAKVKYLADNVANSALKAYAQGTADGITITATADMPGIDASDSQTTQTGIEAYYNGTILTGKTIDKDKMTVYKIFNTTQNGKYESADEFYVLRDDSETAGLLNAELSNKNNGGDVWTANDSSAVVKSFEDADTVTATADDLNSGVINVLAVVLQKTDDGEVLVDKTKNTVKTFTWQVTIPVKEYTAEDDFLENYGSYQSVINTINELTTNINTLNSKISDLEKANIDLTDKNANLESEKEDLQNDLNVAYAELTALQTQLATVINNYTELLNVTEVGASDYTYSITGEDGTVKDYVIVNGKDIVYDKNTGTEIVLPDGSKVMVYDATDSEGQAFKFYIADDGVHIVTVGADNSITEISVSNDTLVALQRKIAAEITALKGKYEKLAASLNGFGNALKDWIDGYDEESFKALSDDEKIAKINAAIGSLQTAYADYKGKYETLNGQYETLKNATDNLTTANEDITAAKDALEQYLNNKESAEALGLLNSAYEKMDSSYAALNNSYASLKTAYEAIKTPADQVTEAYDAITAAKKKLGSAYASLTDAKDKLDSGVAPDEIYTDLSAAQGNLESASQKLQTASDELSQKIGSLQSTVGDYQTALKNIRSALGLAVTDSATITDITAKIDDLKDKYDTLAGSITALCNKLKEIGIDITLPENATETDKLDAIYAAVAALKDSYDNLKADYNAVLRKIYGETDETVDMSDKTVAEVMTQVEALKGDTSAIEDQIQDAIGGSGEDKKDLTELLNEVKKMSQDLSEKNDLLKQIRETLGVTDNAQILQKIISLQTENTKLKNQVANGTTDTSSYINGYNEGYASAVKTLANSSTANAALTTQVNTLTAENSSLSNEVSTLKAGINDLYDGILEKGTVSSAGKALNSTGADVTSYTRKLDKVETYYGQAIERANSLEKENETISGKYSTLNEKYKNLVTKNETISDKYSALNKKYKSLVTKNDSLSETVKTLKATVSSQNSTITKLKNSSNNSNSTSNSITNRPQTSAGTSSSAVTQTTVETTASKQQSQTSDTQTAKINVQKSSSANDSSGKTSKDKEDTKAESEDTEESGIIGGTEPSDASGTLEELPDTNSSFLGSNDMPDTETTDDVIDGEVEEQGGNPVALILFGVVLISIIGGIVFVFIIKPRLNAREDDGDDGDDDDDDETV